MRTWPGCSAMRLSQVRTAGKPGEIEVALVGNVGVGIKRNVGQRY